MQMENVFTETEQAFIRKLILLKVQMDIVSSYVLKRAIIVKYPLAL